MSRYGWPVPRIARSYVALAGASVLFVALLVTVLVEPGPTTIDAGILLALEGWRSASMSLFVGRLTDLGGRHLMIPMSTVLVVGVFWRWRRAGFFLAIALLGSALLNEGMKVLVDRPRPTLVLLVEHARGLSFPSGHSQSTMAFALACFLLVFSARPRWRRWAGLLFILPLVVGWTRTYLGVHYPTDVLAGWCLAAVWVLGCWTWFRHDEWRPFAGCC